MRMAALDLRAYGHFTDQSLEFPGEGLDLHLVIGPNEAGKSTIREAIADFLFGFQPRTRFNFLHANKDLRVGMRLERGPEVLEGLRLKKTKDSLIAADGKALNETPLLGWLGGMDRSLFIQLFGLNWDRLHAGAQDMLQARGDLGALLFEAASGLRHLTQLREQLASTADDLLGARAARSKPFGQARGRLLDAARRLGEAQTLPSNYQELKRAERGAGRALAQAAEVLDQENQALARLKRIRAAAPGLSLLDESLEELTALADVVQLPVDAAARFKSASEQMGGAQVSLGLRQQDLEAARSKLQAIQPGGEIAQHAQWIVQLADQARTCQEYDLDLPEQLRRETTQRAEVCELAAEMGWGQLRYDEVVERVSLRPLWSELRELVARQEVRLADLKVAEEARDKLEDEQLQLQEQLRREPVQPVGEALLLAVEACAPFTAARRQERVHAEVQARENLDLAVQALAPFGGDCAAVLALNPPDPLSAQGYRDRDKDAEQSIATLQQAILELEEQQAERAASLEALRTSTAAVSREELKQARAKRDACWGEIKQTGELAAQAPQLDQQIQQADQLSDQRYEHSTEAHQIESLQLELVQLGQKRARRERQLAARTQDREGNRQAWRKELEQAGLPELSWSRYAAWVAKRDAVLRCEKDWREAGQALRKQDRELFEVREQLQEQWRNAGLGELPAELPLEHLRGLAAQRIKTLNQAWSAYQAVQGQLQKLAHQRPAMQQKLERAQALWDQWQADWRRVLAKLQLAPELSASGAAQVIEMAATQRQKIKEVADRRRERIEPMQQNLAALEARVRTLAANIGFDAGDRDAVRLALAMGQALEQALRRDAEREKQALEITRIEAAMGKAQDQHAQAQAQLEPLFAQAGLAREDLAALETAIEKSHAYRDLIETRQKQEHSLIQAHDGLSIEALRAEVASIDLAHLSVLIEKAEQAVAEAVGQYRVVAQQHAEARTRLDQVDDSGKAAQAEAERQCALAEMAEVSGSFIRARLQERMLAHAIERFRERHQSPMLQAASGYFQALTQGSFDRLEVDWEQQVPVIAGVKGRQRVHVEAMSDGSRDQLYLALRLAALELQLDQGVVLPFIADDLLINADDQRSAAAFAALARLARKTQVIYFTHHHHLEDVMLAATGGQGKVLHLGQGVRQDPVDLAVLAPEPALGEAS